MDEALHSINRLIVDKAIEFGASLAGLTPSEALKASPSYQMYDRSPYYEGYAGVTWPSEALSVLVLALQHDPAEPGLDWWSDQIPGRTPGNRLLMKFSRRIKNWLAESLDIKAVPLAYSIEDGGIFLKDAAALAGLGLIGKHNLFISPKYGTRVRLRGLFLDKELPPTKGAVFTPCDDCSRPCHQVCPENAFRNGRYDVALCEREMQKNRHKLITVEGAEVRMDERCEVVQFCRACELACPVG
jgi:epoxyqueuosine reductase